MDGDIFEDEEPLVGGNKLTAKAGEQCCHETMAVIMPSKEKLSTKRDEPATLDSYNKTEENLKNSQEDDGKIKEEEMENEEIEGNKVNDRNESRYPNHSESPSFSLEVAGPSGIHKEAHHTCGPSGSKNKMAPIKEKCKEVKINMPQDDHHGDVEQADNFHANDLLCFAWQVAKGMVSSVNEETFVIL